MKRMFLFFLSILFNITAIAKNGLFLQPVIGAGITNTKTFGDYYLYPWTGRDPSKNIFSYSAGTSIGYKWNNFCVSAGLSWSKTGYKNDFIGLPDSNNYTDAYRIIQYYYHLLLTVSIAYEIKTGKRLFFRPALAAATSYNISSTVDVVPNLDVLHYNNYSKHMPAYNRRLTNKEFNDQYRPMSKWGALMLDAGYKLNNSLSVIVGPECQFMLTNFWKNKDNYPGKRMLNHAYTINLGVIWNLKGNK